MAKSKAVKMASSKGPRFLSAIVEAINGAGYIHRGILCAAKHVKCISTNSRGIPETNPLVLGLKRDCRNAVKAYATAAKPQPTHVNLPQDAQRKMADDEWAAAKPFSKIPTPTAPEMALSTVKSLLQGQEDSHWQLIEGFQKYGSVFRVKAGFLEFLMLKDLEATEKMLRLEGKYPRRITLGPWKEWREKNGHAMSFLTV